MDMSNTATDNQLRKLREYLFVSERASWGETITNKRHAKLCDLAEGWLTDNEPEHISIEIKANGNGVDAPEGLYFYTGICLIPWSGDELDELIGKAMAYAWEML